ncbi:diaminopimelate epimerase [Oscillospiraceae bacterium]|nr:diaminopimelate epimerase [Oscillospiraceae bacterium]
MKLHFSKMHGLGNDYIYVNCLEHKLKHPEEVARIVSDRHFGVGSDGLILICPSDRADFEMRMFNADGSEGKMCGNAIRCVGKYVYDRGFTDRKTLQIDTRSGVKTLELTLEDDGKVSTVRVDMGRASLRARDIPVETDYDDFVSQPMLVHGEVFLVTCVSMGNPHAVIFCDDVEDLPLEDIGPLFENHEKFPDRINTEFIELVDRQTLKMRVWERGSGETFACGTGACAAVVAAVVNGHCDAGDEVTVRLRGGELKITCREDFTVLMEGPAAHVFDGVMEIDL